MREFDYSKYNDIKLSNDIVNLLTRIHEAKGREELYLSRKPEELDRLVELTKIQSTEASNAIEGIKTTGNRLKQLVHNKTTPRNRNEDEISGYSDALRTIHESFEYIPLSVNNILELHKIMFLHVKNNNFGGKIKNVENYIQGIDNNGKAYTLFTPLTPLETPSALTNLCNEYNKKIKENNVDPLILIPIFIHDFLCIHPFMDGNGRMSRLLTTLLLYRSGYLIGKYISLEAKISNIKDLYYDSLIESQIDWHKGKDDPLPFVKYMLSIIDLAYKDFEERLDLVTIKVNSNIKVRLAFDKKIGKITKSDVAELCPGISISAIEKGIAKLLKEGKIEKQGKGKNTFYIKK